MNQHTVLFIRYNAIYANYLTAPQLICLDIRCINYWCVYIFYVTYKKTFYAIVWWYLKMSYCGSSSVFCYKVCLSEVLSFFITSTSFQVKYLHFIFGILLFHVSGLTCQPTSHPHSDVPELIWYFPSRWVILGNASKKKTPERK